MFEKNETNLIYNIICFITFLSVILFVNSLITLILLLIFFFVCFRKENNLTLAFLGIIALLSLIISSMFHYYLLFKILLSIAYGYYFIKVSRINENSGLSQEKMVEENKLTDDEIIRFKEKRKGVKKNFNLSETYYLTYHLGVLFLTILVGKCVI